MWCRRHDNGRPAKPLHENFEAGSVIFVDEASEVYPPRSAATRLPVHVQGLNTLRHHGLTLILITQHPSMIDPFVRNLVGKHIHIDRKQIGSKLYEWNTVQTSFSKTSFADAFSVPYVPDKRTFDLYTSSSKHIKFKKSLSWYWYAIPVLPFLLGGLYWFTAGSLQTMAGQTPQPKAVSQPPPVAAVPPPPLPSPTVVRQPETRADNLAASDFVPTVPGHDETAPIYNPVRRVADFPQVVGCISSSTSCRCYTQQGTEVDSIDTKACRKRMRRRPFNPYQDPNNQPKTDTPVNV
ncbi:MAG: zonular occludens toxin domain-containing protein [Conchiformibius sp.]|nr:zonular occludens toxin domain-containing protein [Conchiformibius sp.]